MLEFLTPDRMANAICLDKNFKGFVVLVEGKKDLKLYDRFIDKSSAKIVPTFGKYNLKEVYTLLTKRDFPRKIGLRDADFLRIGGNPKYDPAYAEEIFATDFHDSEIMMIKSHACRNLLRVIIDDAKLSDFEQRNGLLLRDFAFNLCYSIGCLRLANKRFDLGLSFKPDKPEGNRIKFKSFICNKTGGYLGDDRLVNTVFEYSKNRGNIVAPKDLISEKLAVVMAESHPADEMVCGHDMSEVLTILVRDVLKSASKLLSNSDCIEDMLILGFDAKEFSKTQLFSKLATWENSSGNKILL
ncbi:DUF4435 domain-containing protein [Duganella sp. S19_KUP01_CR8]|uniref:DUF4435 domain-containing protein n=1 Tax=Duganella sp. S19_KUP01_CR8 TaxID=3025502 RepID=UPI002FCDD055